MPQRPRTIQAKVKDQEPETPSRIVVNMTEVSVYLGFPFGHVIVPGAHRIGSALRSLVSPDGKAPGVASDEKPIEKPAPVGRPVRKAA